MRWITLLCTLFAFSARAQAQTQAQAPDLRGIWEVSGMAYQNIEGLPLNRDAQQPKASWLSPGTARFPTVRIPEKRRTAISRTGPRRIRCSSCGRRRI